jgi:hypothetical protein
VWRELRVFYKMPFSQIGTGRVKLRPTHYLHEGVAYEWLPDGLKRLVESVGIETGWDWGVSMVVEHLNTRYSY